LIDQADITDLDPAQRNIGMVFQNYALFPHMSVARNVAYPLAMRGMPKAEIAIRVKQALDMVELGAMAERLPKQLSGGQQQRVSVARALYNDRSIVIGDEPVSALDRLQGADILEKLRARHDTAILAMHDIPLALAHADRVVVIEQGRIVLDASARTITAGDLVPYYGG